LHRETRSRDGKGRIVATLGDYEAVRRLYAPLIADSAEMAIPGSVRETVEAVRRLAVSEPDRVRLGTLAARLGIDRSAASRRVTLACDRDYIKKLDPKPGTPLRLALGESMPQDEPILPSVAATEAHEKARLAGNASPPAGADADHCSVARLEGDDASPPPARWRRCG
jgi:hypothetical protein